MGNLTYREPDGSWGLVGVGWKEMANLPPQVYGALCKLRDLEHPDCELEDEKKGGEQGWLEQRFNRVI